MMWMDATAFEVAKAVLWPRNDAMQGSNTPFATPNAVASEKRKKFPPRQGWVVVLHGKRRLWELLILPVVSKIPLKARRATSVGFLDFQGILGGCRCCVSHG